MRAGIGKTQKIALKSDPKLRCHGNANEFGENALPWQPEDAPKGAKSVPRTSREHSGACWERPGASLERPECVPGALRDPLERSKGAPERLGGDLGLIWYAKWCP